MAAFDISDSPRRRREWRRSVGSILGKRGGDADVIIVIIMIMAVRAGTRELRKDEDHRWAEGGKSSSTDTSSPRSPSPCMKGEGENEETV